MRFVVYFDSILSLKICEKYYFLYKNFFFLDTRLLLGITHGEILKTCYVGCDLVYILKEFEIKWLFSYRNIYIHIYSTVTRILFRGTCY